MVLDDFRVWIMIENSNGKCRYEFMHSNKLKNRKWLDEKMMGMGTYKLKFAGILLQWIYSIIQEHKMKIRAFFIPLYLFH